MRNLLAGLPLALVLGTTAMTHAAEIVAPSNIPTAQTVVTLSAGTDTVLGSGTTRRYLCLMNIGTGLVTLGFDRAAVVESGWALEPATSAGHAGGSMCWESSLVTGSAVHAISAAGSIVAVLEAR